MTTTLKVILVFNLTLLLGCATQSDDSSNSLKKTQVSLGETISFLDTPRCFVKNYIANETSKFFVFIGKKIAFDPLPHEKGNMDNGFKAKYAILEKVYGNFPQDTIEFIAYDHYGIPFFSKFRNVLIYVSCDSGTFFHEKYMYNDVYKTKDGRWAGTYAWEDYAHEGNKKTTLKPIKIDFKDSIFYPLLIVTEQGVRLKRTLPNPYFRTIGDSALALYGNYVDDLFILKRDGYLTARKIFKNGTLTQ